MGRWEVSAYVWLPNQITVNQGDDVTLDFVGINGAAHPVTIQGYAKPFVVTRGATTKITFKADNSIERGVRVLNLIENLPPPAADNIDEPQQDDAVND